jgi:hypothetical protein
MAVTGETVGYHGSAAVSSATGFRRVA